MPVGDVDGRAGPAQVDRLAERLLQLHHVRHEHLAQVDNLRREQHGAEEEEGDAHGAQHHVEDAQPRVAEIRRADELARDAVHAAALALELADAAAADDDLVADALVAVERDVGRGRLEVAARQVHDARQLLALAQSPEAACWRVGQRDVLRLDAERERHERHDTEVEGERQQRLAVLVGDARPLVGLVAPSDVHRQRVGAVVGERDVVVDELRPRLHQVVDLVVEELVSGVHPTVLSVAEVGRHVVGYFGQLVIAVWCSLAARDARQDDGQQ